MPNPPVSPTLINNIPSTVQRQISKEPLDDKDDSTVLSVSAHDCESEEELWHAKSRLDVERRKDLESPDEQAITREKKHGLDGATRVGLKRKKDQK